MSVPGIELRSLNLATGIFFCWAISADPFCILFSVCISSVKDLLAFPFSREALPPPQAGFTEAGSGYVPRMALDTRLVSDEISFPPCFLNAEIIGVCHHPRLCCFGILLSSVIEEVHRVFVLSLTPKTGWSARAHVGKWEDLQGIRSLPPPYRSQGSNADSWACQQASYHITRPRLPFLPQLSRYHKQAKDSVFFHISTCSSVFSDVISDYSFTLLPPSVWAA